VGSVRFSGVDAAMLTWDAMAEQLEKFMLNLIEKQRSQRAL
jgi:hypothetical protein